MAKLTITTEQNRPIHEGRVFPYLAVTKLVVDLPISAVGSRYEGGTLYAEIKAFAEIEDDAGVVRVYHPEWARSITIPNFQPSGDLLAVAAGLINASLTDLQGVGVTG